MADQGKHQLEKVVVQTIAKRRQSLGISQFELAERLNIAPASLSRIENGLAAPRFSRLEEIAEILDCPVSVLFRMNDETLKNTSDTIAELVGSLPPESNKFLSFSRIADYIASEYLKITMKRKDFRIKMYN